MTDPRRARILAAGVLVGALAVYVATLHPSVPGGDSGELIAVAARLKVAHPPGYPLYTVLAKLATLLPVGSTAWRVNLLSALCDAGAAAVIAATVTAASGSPAGGLVAGGLFAFSPLVWTHAVAAEVFPLNNLIVALFFLLALSWARARETRVAVAIAAVLGLGLANHHALVFYAGPGAVWLFWSGRPQLLRPRALAELALAATLGIAWYAYLPLAARHATTLSWGDPTTLRGFIDHVTRRDYGTFRLASGIDPAASSFAERITAFLAHTSQATLFVGLLLAAIAIVAWLRQSRTRSWMVLLLACFTTYVLGFHALANLPVNDPLYAAVTARFWQQPDVVTFILIGLGFAIVAAKVPRALRPLVPVAAVTLVALQLALALPSHDRHRDDTVARYGRALLEALPPGTLLLTHGDLVTNVTRYLQACEGVRPDVVVLDQELMTKPWYVARAAREFPGITFPARRYDPTRPDGFSMRAFLAANAAGRTIAVYPEWKSGDPSVAGAYELWPLGLASRVAPLATPPPLADWQRESAGALATLDRYGWPALGAYAPGTWERVVLEDVWQAHHRAGWWLLVKAIAADNDPQLLTAARIELESAARAHPSPPWFLYRNLGLVYERLALRDPALRQQQLAAWRRYLAAAPADDDGRGTIAATVARLEAQR